MSDNIEQPGLPQYPATPETALRPAPDEQVGRGLLFAFAAVLGGIVLTVVIWQAGFVAAISSFALAAGAVFLYDKGAGAPPRKGLVPLIALIVVGVVAGFFAVIASDAWKAYDELPIAEDRITFVLNNIFEGEVIKAYAKDMVWYFGFAAFGVFGTLRRLLAAN